MMLTSQKGGITVLKLELEFRSSIIVEGRKPENPEKSPQSNGRNLLEYGNEARITEV